MNMDAVQNVGSDDDSKEPSCHSLNDMGTRASNNLSNSQSNISDGAFYNSTEEAAMSSGSSFSMQNTGIANEAHMSGAKDVAEVNMPDGGELNAALECAVCLEVLSTDNRVLPCQHTFCSDCLRAVKQSLIDQDDKFRCPECCTVMSVDIEQLPRNIILNRVLNSLNSPKVKPAENRQQESGGKKRKRVRPLPDSDDTGDTDDDLPVTTSKKGRKPKPIHSSDDESIEEDTKADCEQPSSEEGNRETVEKNGAVKEANDSEATENEAISGVSDSEATENEAAIDEGSDSDETGENSDNGTRRASCDNEEQKTPTNQRLATVSGSTSRRSSRLKEKHSKIFRKPRKEDVLNKIPSLPDGDRSLSESRPRKLVTSFTKINSRYNYDRDYTSGEDSAIANFLDDEHDYIDDDSLVSEDSNYEPKGEEKKGKKNKRQRKKTVVSDGSSESSVSDGVEYSSEETDSDPSDKTPQRRHSHRKKSQPLKRIYRSPSSSSDNGSGVNDSEDENIGDDSSKSCDLGESSKSILEQVSERSRTMSARKRQQASRFEEIRKLREQKQKKK